MRVYHTIFLILIWIISSHSTSRSLSAESAPHDENVSAEPAIEHIGQLATPGFYSIVVSGSHAYGIDISYNIRIIDISQPTQPTLVRIYDPPWFAYSIKLIGHLLYTVSSATCADCYSPSVVRVLDVSNPTQPVEIGAYSAPELGISGMVVSNNYMYVTTAAALEVVDVTNPTTPRRVGAWTPYLTPGAVVEISEGYVYTISSSDALNVVDVRDPTHPTATVENFDLQLGPVLDTAFAGRRLYTASGGCTSGYCGGAVTFVDVSNPAQPAVVGSYSLSAAILGVEAVGSLIYLSQDYYGNGGLQIVDVSTPTQPHLLAATPASYLMELSPIAVMNSYIYLDTIDSLFIKRYRPSSMPYRSAPYTAPGIIQAEDFDRGGAGTAYVDGDISNRGQAYRPAEAVDLEPTTDQGGGYNVGWTSAGEWLQYTLHVTELATYTLRLRLASNGGHGALHFEIDGTKVAEVASVPHTGGYQAWQTITIGNMPLTAGEHVLRVVMVRDGLNNNVANLNYIQLLALNHMVYAPWMERE
jgi:hypothetical protein